MGKGTGKVFGTIGNVATGGLLGATTGIGVDQPKQLKMPTPEPAPMRELAPEEKDLTPAEIAARASEAKGAMGLMAPGWLGLDSSMSAFQRRTAIATKGTSGDIGTDPEAFKYYRNLAFQTLSEPGKMPTQEERGYLNLFGEPVRDQTAGGYLSAIERIYKRLG